MINYIERANLDVAKYDSCIDNAINTRIYAFSWYLDIVADQWDVLVLNDYEAVMPLPWRRKYRVKYIYNPCWVQQLGIFSRLIVDSTLTNKFIQSIPKKFLKVTLQFNSENQLNSLKNKPRENYLLNLNSTYENIQNGFNKSRKRRLKETFPNQFLIQKGSFQGLADLMKNNYNNFNLVEEDINKLRELIIALKKMGKCQVIKIAKENDTTSYGEILFMVHKNRIIYLLGLATDEGKKSHAMTFGINYIIKQYSKTDSILDFEGSTIYGIASFFKSFGAKKEKYFLFKKLNF